jgi:hypothetical protein
MRTGAVFTLNLSADEKLADIFLLFSCQKSLRNQGRRKDTKIFKILSLLHPKKRITQHIVALYQYLYKISIQQVSKPFSFFINCTVKRTMTK